MSKGSQDMPPMPVMIGAYDKYVNEPKIASIRDSVVSEIEALKPYTQHRFFSGFSLLVADDHIPTTTWMRTVKEPIEAVTIARPYQRRATDKNRRKDDTADMEYVPKDLLDAKLEAIEARMDTRIASIEGKIDAFLVGQAERDKAFEKTTNQRFVQLDKDVTRISESAEKVAEQVSGIRITMAKYLGGAIVIGALASAGLGVLLRYMVTG
ncbi:MAG: hypothetical protein KAI85_07575 [Halopseudomonas aestusnigri]|nr:hypothetical protein [Halopseudomonas aestusnigri]